MAMLCFNFILGLNLIFLCFKLIIIHYHTQKKITFKQRTKLNHNSYNTHVIWRLFLDETFPNSCLQFFFQCLVHTSVARITSVIFSRFSSELRKAGNERGALDTRDVAFRRRARLALLARFPLSLVCYTAVFSVVTQRSSPLKRLCSRLHFPSLARKTRKKITPVMQANTSAISKCKRLSPLIFFS